MYLARVLNQYINGHHYILLTFNI